VKENITAKDSKDPVWNILQLWLPVKEWSLASGFVEKNFCFPQPRRKMKKKCCSQMKQTKRTT
jgi:hypothetical protein